MIKSKKGIELTVNFLVMLVLAIVMFGFGLFFLAKVVGIGGDVGKGLPKIEDTMLDSCLQKSTDCLSTKQFELPPGKTAVSGIGIKNIKGATYSFKVFVTLTKAIDEQGNEIPPPSTTWHDETNKWAFTSSAEYSIKNKEISKVPVSIKVPYGRKDGTYVFDVQVCGKTADNVIGLDNSCTGALAAGDYTRRYGSLHKIYVTVY
ncbi:MAG: hypothetical protein V1859_04685 [archaeon]